MYRFHCAARSFKNTHHIGTHLWGLLSKELKEERHHECHKAFCTIFTECNVNKEVGTLCNLCPILMLRVAMTS
uniref:Uncharacterized protein n=1 Tax=Romanomermis culicivorax TaxID=13658 RepID=A0A915L7F1_ROMCU